mmetsp:Transcript_107644/g.246452  ORF Transcript_107644/g.246452 Transcript_107644/m.246452 type:complete len:115 (+) Transcript_107644:213-557(+)
MVCVVDDFRKPLYFSRVWAVFEVHQAIELNIEAKVALLPSARERFRRERPRGNYLGHIDVRNADASVPADKHRILAMLEDAPGGPGHVNIQVQKLVRDELVRVMASDAGNAAWG